MVVRWLILWFDWSSYTLRYVGPRLAKKLVKLAKASLMDSLAQVGSNRFMQASLNWFTMLELIYYVIILNSLKVVLLGVLSIHMMVSQDLISNWIG